jgi:amino acid adenylation domain-containing protein
VSVAPAHRAAPADATLPELFRRQVVAAPGAVALVAGGEELTYGELDRRVARRARRLVRHGVGPEVLVGVHLGRGTEMVVTLLAVHRAGGAYVPLDPGFPAARLEHMLRDSGAAVVVSERRLGEALPRSEEGGADILWIEDENGEDNESDRAAPAAAALPANLAYVIYTSGSTGRPKGVQVTHGALANFLLSMRERPGLGPDDVLLAVTTLSFDIAALELFLPLIAGGRVVIAPREATLDGARLAALLDACGATALQATPITWKLLLQAGWTGSRRLRLFCGGEALPRELARVLLDRGAELWNFYGPTETTVWSAIARVRPGSGPVPIGRPIAATELLVMDGALDLVPPGTTGDLYLGGGGLARGYFGRPDLTAERFVPHPWSAVPGERLYRTGDLARFLPDGEVDFLGRSDTQVKVRGFRIELGEIESVLLEHPEILDAAVVAVGGQTGEKRLAAFVVARNQTSPPAPSPRPETAELLDLVGRRLPEYMRPAAVTFLDALPLTPNNKVDRQALAALPVARPVEAPAGRTPTEELVVGLWADLLEVGTLGVHDDFFAAGGHSLMAGQVIAELRAQLGLELPQSCLFEHPTAAAFAREVEARLRSGATALPPLAPLAQAERGAPLTASFAQERLWLYDQLEPGSNAFNMGYAFRLRGPLAIAALDASLREVARRHEILRTRVVARGGRPFQVVDPVPGRMLAVADLRGAGDGEAAARRAVVAIQSRPFDLARGPLVRAVLLRIGDDESVFCLALHHILSDGWSLALLIREMTALYGAFIGNFGTAGGPSPLPELAVQYADFAAWQRSWLQGDLLEAQLRHWQERLGGGPRWAALPVDRANRSEGGAGGPVDRVEGAVPREVVERLHALGRAHGATLFMTLLAGLQALLHRYTGSARIAVGSLSANRSHSAVEPLIGFFVNVLALDLELDGGWSFSELLARVRQAALIAFAHQDAPYEKVVERVRPQQSDRAAGRNALFQVMVVLQNVPLPELALSGIEVGAFALARPPRRAAFDLSLEMVAEGGGLTLYAEYDTYVFERATVERLVGHFGRLLHDAAEDPARRLGELPVATAGDRAGPGGTLWLTDPPAAGVGDGGDETASERWDAPAGGRPRTAEIQEQVAARRSRLSDKQLALLRQRLKAK